MEELFENSSFQIVKANLRIVFWASIIWKTTKAKAPILVPLRFGNRIAKGPLL